MSTQTSPTTIPNLNGKKILILGGSNLQVPAIIEARAMGLISAVLDYDSHCPGRDLADVFFLDSTTDEEAVYQRALEFEADGIMTLGTDWPMRSVAYACERLGLPAISYRAAQVSTNKWDMIEELAKANVAHPKYLFFDYKKQPASDISDQMSLPLIIKPIDASGSRGVVLLTDWADLADSLAYSASQAKHHELIVQEFMQGPEVSVEVIIIRGTPYVLTITDKVTTGRPHFVETKHTQPSRLDPERQVQIAELAKASCRALQLDTGAAHVEIIDTVQGPKIVEVGPRMGGDYIASHLVQLSTGINMTRLVILEAMGLEVELPPVEPAGACIRYLDRGPGIYRQTVNLDEVRQMPGIVHASVFLNPGAQVRDLTSSTDRLGYIIAQGETADEADRLACLADDHLIIQMERP